MREGSSAGTRVMRSARQPDLAAVHALLAASGLMLDDVAQHLEDGYVVAMEGGDLIGVAGVERYERDGLLRSVAVAASHRGNGIGAALTRERVAWARGHGLLVLWLLTEDAAPFFAREGFEVVDRSAVPAAIAASRQYAVGCPSSSTLMRKALDGVS